MNFIKAVQTLVDADVDFVIIGGWSAVLNGSSYVTNDLDICYSNLNHLAIALAPYHPRLRDMPSGLPFVWDERTLGNGTVFTLATDLGVIDLLAEVSGLSGFEEVKANSIRVQAFDREVYTLNLPALIRSKRAAGRLKDLQILPELESLLEAQDSE
jgi:hypothetical protein